MQCTAGSTAHLHTTAAGPLSTQPVHQQAQLCTTELIASTQLSPALLITLVLLPCHARLYLWRVTLPDQPPVLTSIKAACLAPAFDSPQYALHLDSAGHIMSAQISVPVAALPGGSCSTSHALQALQVGHSAGGSRLSAPSAPHSSAHGL